MEFEHTFLFDFDPHSRSVFLGKIDVTDQFSDDEIYELAYKYYEENVLRAKENYEEDPSD